MTTKQIFSGIIFALIVIGVISYLITGSINPMEVFKSDNLIAKILIGFFALGILFQTGNYLILKRIPVNAKCKISGLNIRDYYFKMGGAYHCPSCGNYYLMKFYKEKHKQFWKNMSHCGCEDEKEFDIFNRPFTHT